MSDTENVQPSTALDTPRKRFENMLTQIVQRGKDQLARHIDPATLTRVVLTEATRNPTIMECSPTSIALAVSLCGQLGLAPTGPLGHAYLIPRRNHGTQELTVIIGYKGLAELARRSGQIGSMDARVVYEGDEFEFEFGPNGYLRHKPGNGSRDNAAIRFAYAWVKTKDGQVATEVLPVVEIEERRKRGASGRGSKTPWDTDYAAMARKTALRKLLTGGTVPMSIEVAEAMENDDPDYIDGGEVEVKPARARRPSLGLTAKSEPDVAPAFDAPVDTAVSGDEGDAL